MITPSVTTMICKSKSYFLDAVETGSHKNTVDCCTSLALDVMKKVIDKYNCKDSQLCDRKRK